MRLKLVPRTQVEEMAETLALQARRLHELETKLQKEKQEKANLEIDFQHLLDLVRGITRSDVSGDKQLVICG